MKIKVLGTVGLAGLLLLAGCSKADTNTAATNANRANGNMMTNTAVTTTTPMATPVVQTGESAAIDSVLKTKIETAMKGKGFNNVVVDASTGTLRGTYPKGKLAEVVQTATQAAGKPLKNEMAEAK